MTTVINVRDKEAVLRAVKAGMFVYIGRDRYGVGRLGNKYTHLTTTKPWLTQVPSRKEAIMRHMLDLLASRTLVEWVRNNLKDKVLACWCIPQQCHGENYVKVAEGRVCRIISGGQTGADFGGLLAAESLNLVTGGTAPKGYRTERGFNLDLKGYGLVESPSSDYSRRTEVNVKDSDGTLIFGKVSVGSVETNRLCIINNKPVMWVHLEALPKPSTLREWIKKHRIATLNVAGNRESVSPGIQERVREYLIKELS